MAGGIGFGFEVQGVVEFSNCLYMYVVGGVDSFFNRSH